MADDKLTNWLTDGLTDGLSAQVCASGIWSNGVGPQPESAHLRAGETPQTTGESHRVWRAYQVVLTWYASSDTCAGMGDASPM